MRLAPTLLRLLLIISLLVNGLGVAVAGVHADSPSAQHGATTHSPSPPCHGMDMAPGQADGPATVPHASKGQDQHCSGIDCLRACAQQPALTVSALLLPATDYNMSAPIAALEPGRPAPPLPAITRPPIG